MGVQRILVTGGAGFVGSRLTAALVGAGHRVTVVDNLSSMGSQSLLSDVSGAYEFVHADIRCREDFERIPAGGFDRVYHLAASFANARSIKEPEYDFRTNVIGTENVVRFAERRGCGLFVYTGSSSSYGAAPAPFVEDGPMIPATPYAWSKKTGEDRVRASALPAAIFRLFNVYGPGDVPGVFRNAIPNMLAALHEPRGVVTVHDAASSRDFTFVDDVVGVLRDAESGKGTTTNVGTGHETPVIELASQMLHLLDLPKARIQTGQRRVWDTVVRRRASTERLAERFGRVPSTTLADGLPRTLTWLRAKGYLPPTAS